MPIDVLEQYSLPINNNLYGKPPYYYKDAETIMVPFMSDPKVISELVPEPMKANPDGSAIASFNNYNCAGFGRSIEAFFIIPVTFEGDAGLYIANAFLNNDRPMAGGREIWGYEKKLAHMKMGENNDGIVYGSAERGGSVVQKVLVERKAWLKPEDIPTEFVTFTVKLIPSAEKDAPPAVAQIVKTDLSDTVKYHSFETGPAALEFPMTPASFLHTIPILEVFEGSYSKWDCVLDYGTIVHDYLKPKKSTKKRKTKKKPAKK